eukprot:4518784-Amphidinium_carterae.1
MTSLTFRLARVGTAGGGTSVLSQLRASGCGSVLCVQDPSDTRRVQSGGDGGGGEDGMRRVWGSRVDGGRWSCELCSLRFEMGEVCT